jgi:hypothetical protein
VHYAPLRSPEQAVPEALSCSERRKLPLNLKLDEEDRSYH